MTATRPDPDLLLPPAALAGWQSRVTQAAGEPVGRLFAAGLHRTLARTLHTLDDGTVFVITGDIPAMWLRDSATQMLPYLRIVTGLPDSPLADLLARIVRRQTAFIRHDPYANAFNIGPNGRCHEPRDLSDDPSLWERKYEIDSLCFPFQLAHGLWAATGRTDFLGDEFAAAATAAVDTLERETDHEARSSYRFVRPTDNPLETLDRDGLGTPVAVTGLTWGGFRPSDDACRYGYNIPGNLMAAHTLRMLAELLPGSPVADRAAALADRITDAVGEHGLVEHPVHGEVLAYEVDGLGNQLLMDDANMPGLLSLPLTAGLSHDDPLYLRTRAFALSKDNPFYFVGTVATGIGSPHTRDRYVWPIALAVEGLTTDDRDRRLELLRLIESSTGGTGHVHESFDVDDDTAFSRPWFSWADSMFCALALSLVD